jgi:TPR repeat protein
MSDPTVTSIPPISKWPPELRSIVRCLEAMETARSKNSSGWNQPPDQYRKLVTSLEDALVADGGQLSAIGLAELSISDDSHMGFIPFERRLKYLFAAANNDHPNAQVALAKLADRNLIPLSGIDCRFDDDKGSPRWNDFNAEQSDLWWNAAAKGGHSHAQYIVGIRLIDSALTGDVEDVEKFSIGAHWLREAVYSEPPDPEAQNELAYQLELGRVSPDSPEWRWQLYEAAANAGIVGAMLAAGHYLENGIGVEKDDEAAFKWYSQAAKRGAKEGHLLAWQLTDDIYHLGEAANAGFVEAMVALAPKLFSDAICGSWDSDHDRDTFWKGLILLEKAASKGNCEAAIELARISEHGWQDHFPAGWEECYSENDRREAAVCYYEQARELGCKWASGEIERLRALLDGDEAADSTDD